MGNNGHFEGLDVGAHLKAARQKGTNATSEIHGTELSGAYMALCDSAKTSASFLLIGLSALTPFASPSILPIILLISAGLIIWNTGRSALLGWFRLERLHRLIEEERYEIEHHREQEKQELRAMYAAKGLSGHLLDEVIDILMADDNRLLGIMLEEELGLSLEAYEHPLRQASGAFLGSLIASSLFWIASLFHFHAALATAFIIVGFFSYLSARQAKNQATAAITWNIGLLFVSFATAYFLSQMVAEFLK